MNIRYLAMCMCTAAFAGACSDDPLGAGIGDPAAIVTDTRRITVNSDAEFTITAFAIDETFRRIPGVLAATSAGPAVVVDSIRYVPELAQTLVFATGSSTTEGTDITIAGHTLSAVTTVVVAD